MSKGFFSNFLSSLLNYWRNLTISKKMHIFVSGMIVLLLFELFAVSFSIDKMAAIRGYIMGEGFWSKSQKDSIYLLQKYIYTKSEEDYEAFLNSFEVTEGLKNFRNEVVKPQYDLEKVKNALSIGKVHEDDHIPTINLIVKYGHFDLLIEAVELWGGAEEELERVKLLASEFRDYAKFKKYDAAYELNVIKQIHDSNNKLTSLETRFSELLGQGGRLVEKLILYLLIFLFSFAGLLTILLTYLTKVYMVKDLVEINSVLHNYGEGNFSNRLDSSIQDELGQVKKSINQMGDLLDISYDALKKSRDELEEKVLVRTKELSEIALKNKELYEEAQKAIDLRDDFLSIASHELRTPLTALNLQLHILDKFIKDGKAESNPELLNKHSEKASLLMRKLATLQEVLLDLAQINNGKLELKKVSTNIVQLVQDSVSQLTSEALKSETEIICQSMPSLVIAVDATRVSQVINNLIGNAIKYASGKPIHVSIQKIEEKNRVEIIIKDHGPGIPQEKHDKVFERFERAHEGAFVSGLGLGLYISKQIVEAHEGTLRLLEDKGDGATFVVELPLS